MAYILTPERLAALATINWCEGSPDYDQAFGYAAFNNLGPHPGTKYTFDADGDGHIDGNDYTTAAGAYQFLLSTWTDAINGLGIPNYMSAENQDQAAMWLIDVKRKCLSYIDNGDIVGAMDKLSYEWASLPPGRYGQPIKTMEQVQNYYADSLAFYRGNNTLSPVGYNEAVKKKFILKRVLPLRLSLPSYLRTFFYSRKLNDK